MNIKEIAIKQVDGGVCAPQGFRAAGVYCGIRDGLTKKDLAMIVSDVRAAAAGVYTTNKVKGAPIAVTKKHIADGYAQAVICNSGNANTCNADGIEIAEGMSQLAADVLGLVPEDIIVGSTGVIGERLSLDPVKKAIDGLAAQLSYDGSSDAAESIMTTDTVKKEAAFEFELGPNPNSKT